MLSPFSAFDPPLGLEQQLGAACRIPVPCCAALLLTAALACGTTEGPLLRAADAGTAASALDRGAAGAGIAQDAGVGRVTQGMRLHYQITGSPQLDAAADLFVLDLFDTDAAQLTRLHAQGRVVIAYLSAGSHEPWRPDAEDFPAQAVGAPLAGYPDERWLDIRDATVRELMAARLRLARDKGFDGVFPGALDVYRSSSGFALSETDQLLSSAARALGLSAGASGDFALREPLIEQFDWALAIGCIAADSCARLQPWLAQDKPVFDVELEGELSQVCAQAQALGLSVVMKRPGFDAWSRSCP
jgi:hypothetical protein